MLATLFICKSDLSVPVIIRYVCVLRSLSVGLFISADYWWTTNVLLRGIDQVSLFLERVIWVVLLELWLKL